MLKSTLLLFGFAVIVVISAVPAKADFVVIAQPNAAYTSSTTLIPITAPDFTDVNSVSNGTITVGFSQALNVRTVPGGGFNNWGSPPFTETATPRLVVCLVGNTCSITMNLSSGVRTFGIEMEGDLFGTFPITAQFFNGATLVGTIAQTITSPNGARLFAASTSTDVFTSVVVSIPGTAGLPIGQFRYSAQGPGQVPEPTTMLLLGTGLAGVAARLKRRKKQIDQ